MLRRDSISPKINTTIYRGVNNCVTSTIKLFLMRKNMNNKLFLIIAVFILSKLPCAGQQEQSNYGISFSGFVKSDLIFDSRQTVSLREGHFLLYPANELLDKNNDDVNAKSNFNMLSIQTRLIGKITGPDAFDAKTSGLIEGEFFGTSDADVNGFRLRHAFVKLDWEKISLLVGQTWHPMFVAEVFPGVVSFNTGAPFQPFSRNPQVRLTHTIGDLKMIAVAASQRDFQSFGSDKDNKPTLSSAYLRNSVLPNLHLQFQYKLQDHLFGIGGDYKKLTPRIVTNKNIQTNESIGSLSAIAYTKLNLSSVTFKAEGVLGENLADMLMLGGYAAKSLDTLTGIETYSSVKCLSIWGELSYGKEIEFAVFGGYTKNLGAKDNLIGTLYSRGTDIDNLFRISPRIQWNSGKTRISTELEYTSAAYGTVNRSDKGKVENVKSIANTRVLVAVFYFF